MALGCGVLLPVANAALITDKHIGFKKEPGQESEQEPCKEAGKEPAKLSPHYSGALAREAHLRSTMSR